MALLVFLEAWPASCSVSFVIVSRALDSFSTSNWFVVTSLDIELALFVDVVAKFARDSFVAA